jgi:hypothetical protein
MCFSKYDLKNKLNLYFYLVLIPKGLDVPGVAKPDLGNDTWSEKKIRFKKKIVNMRLVFQRSLGRAGMCWSQPPRVDHMCKTTVAK